MKDGSALSNSDLTLSFLSVRGKMLLGVDWVGDCATGRRNDARPIMEM
jgi:hypothetical protein